MIKKTLLVFAALMILLLGLAIFLINSGPIVPDGVDKIITELSQEELPEFILGKTGIAQNDDIDIWYESREPLGIKKGTVLLVMGYATTCLAWPEELIQPMVDSGYQVIRYDNRGVGMSDWVEDWNEENPYTLEDMAKDGLSILDELGISKAHIMGVSMGGMIAQRMAISHSDRVASLTSVMSSGFYEDPELISVSPEFERAFLKLGLKYGLSSTEASRIKLGIGIKQLLQGTHEYPIDMKNSACRTLYELRKRKGFNLSVGEQHEWAIRKSGSRYDELSQITAPTLVIHGTADPLILPAHSEKYAPMIPNSNLLWVEGMGHDLAPEFMPIILTSAFENFEKGNQQDQISEQ